MSFQSFASRFKRETFSLYNHAEPLRSVSSVNPEVEDKARDDGEEGIELSLGLSLHGRFGVDPIRTGKITRSSSISNLLLPSHGGESFKVSASAQGNGVNLLRTCSLPVGTEEEWRKRKDIQMLRRMEAKRKRSEKQQQRTWLSGKEKVMCSGDLSCLIEEESSGMWAKPSPGSDGFSRSSLVGCSRQGSIGSQGSGSSGLSESEGTSYFKFKKKKPFALPSCGSGTVANDGGRSMMLDMPHVSTRGLGPNARRIEGFLYQYGKREEVRIVCVCHGSFHTPAEFVKHAGGDDVAHPLRHIMVDPTPLV